MISALSVPGWSVRLVQLSTIFGEQQPTRLSRQKAKISFKVIDLVPRYPITQVLDDPVNGFFKFLESC